MGLASNIIGLFLFHGEHRKLSRCYHPFLIILLLTEHGHSHGGHSHDEESSISHHVTSQTPTPPAELDGVTPHARSKSISRPREDSFGSLYGHPAQTRAMVIETAQEFGYGRPHKANAEVFSPSSSYPGEAVLSPARSRSVGGRGSGDGRMNSLAERSEGSSERDQGVTHAHAEHDHAHGEENGHSHSNDNGKATPEAEHSHSPDEGAVTGGGGGGHGHSHGHGSMNMKGVFLHVLGDALGNVGVIAAGLVIML